MVLLRAAKYCSPSNPNNMKSISIFIIVLECLVLYSSYKNPNLSSNSQKEIIIDYNVAPNTLIKFSDVFDSVGLTLYRGVGKFTGSVKQIKKYNDLYFASEENSSNRIYVFDREGRLLRFIGSRGRGPGEINTLTDFVINSKNKTLEVYDNATRQINCYDIESGVLKRILKTGIIARDIEILNSGEYIFYSDDINEINGIKINPGILLIDKQGRFVKNMYEFDAKKIKDVINPNSFLCPEKDVGIWFCDLIKSQILCISDGKIIKKVIIIPLKGNNKESNSEENPEGIIFFSVVGGNLICALSTIEFGQHLFISNLENLATFSGFGLIDDLSSTFANQIPVCTDEINGIIFSNIFMSTEEYIRYKKVAKQEFGIDINSSERFKEFEVPDYDSLTMILKIAYPKSNFRLN